MAYNKKLIELLETVYGRGFLSVGGEGAVRDMFKGINLNGKSILDIGCGVGGAEFYLAKMFDCCITGFDTSRFMITEARKRFKTSSCKGNIDFVFGKDLSRISGKIFDIIFTKETLLHIKTKKNIIKKIYQLTSVNNSMFISYEWFRNAKPYSTLMRKFLKFDGLDIFLTTPQAYQDLLTEVGFKTVKYEDSSKSELAKTKEVVTNIQGHLLKTLVVKHGEDYVMRYCIPSWQMQAELINNGELLIGKFIATR